MWRMQAILATVFIPVLFVCACAPGGSPNGHMMRTQQSTRDAGFSGGGGDGGGGGGGGGGY
jgi:hypothetical protein